jgi:radical SAM superfamily enzyme YgiQ (UPF0313 family)
MKSVTLVNVSQRFERGMIPLGLACISAYLKRENKGIEVRILDANCQDIYADFKADTDVIGIGAVTQDLPLAVKFAEFVRSRCRVPLVLGGVHITTCPDLPEQFDIGVIGEGEITMSEIMKQETWVQEEIAKIPGTCHRVDGKTVLAPPRKLADPLDTLPIPDRDAFNLDWYLQPRRLIPYHTGVTLTLMSSRGCPFKCVFCSTKTNWQRFRGHSAERVVEEVELLVNKYGAQYIHLFDDLFIANRKRFNAIHEGIVKKGLNKKVKFMCLIRSDLIDDEMMTKLKEMGVVTTGIGMESGNERVLRFLKQDSTTVEENARAIELHAKYGISIMGTFMVGNPNETEEEMLETLAFIRRFRNVPYFQPLSYIAAVFPGTEFYHIGKAKGLAVDDYSRIAMDIPQHPDDLKKINILTDVPHERFFQIIQEFNMETIIGSQKNPIQYENQAELSAWLCS